MGFRACLRGIVSGDEKGEAILIGGDDVINDQAVRYGVTQKQRFPVLAQRDQLGLMGD